MARLLGMCRVSLELDLGGPEVGSRWAATNDDLEVFIATDDRKEHDIAMELLLCLGQALWEKLSRNQRGAYWRLLDTEFQAGVSGEIDEDAFTEKRVLLRNRFSARSRLRLERYGRASFAGIAAEYVHCRWHDVSVRRGPEDLPARYVKVRLKLLARWFPPDRGHTLFLRRPDGKPE